MLLGVVFCTTLQCCSSSAPEAGRPNRASHTDAEIVVQGSDTMENLVEKLSRDFMAANSGVQVGVQPGDTGSGIKDLLSGKIDVATASREMTEAEQKLAHGEAAHLKRLMIAKDAVAIVVNPLNKVAEVDLNDLAKIYSGEVLTWKQLDKRLADEPVRAFGREVSSGTSDYFQKHVMKGKPFGAPIKLMPSSESLIGAVMGNRLAIGFVGMSQAKKATDKVKVLKLKLSETSPELATGGALSDSDYPLSRPLYLYYNAANQSRVKKFVDYCLGQDGQKTVVSMGFMPAK